MGRLRGGRNRIFPLLAIVGKALLPEYRFPRLLRGPAVRPR